MLSQRRHRWRRGALWMGTLVNTSQMLMAIQTVNSTYWSMKLEMYKNAFSAIQKILMAQTSKLLQNACKMATGNAQLLNAEWANNVVFILEEVRWQRPLTPVVRWMPLARYLNTTLYRQQSTPISLTLQLYSYSWLLSNWPIFLCSAQVRIAGDRWAEILFRAETLCYTQSMWGNIYAAALASYEIFLQHTLHNSLFKCCFVTNKRQTNCRSPAIKLVAYCKHYIYCNV